MFTLPPPYQPVTADATGVLRVGGTRVTLDAVVQAHLDGAPPEEIVTRYPALSLAAAYAAVGFYLRHRVELDAHLAARRDAADAVRRQVLARQGPQTLKARLEARLAAECADAVPGG